MIVPDTQYGYLRVLTKIGILSPQGYNYFACRCSCGAFVKVSGHHLTTRLKKSCGCRMLTGFTKSNPFTGIRFKLRSDYASRVKVHTP